MRDQTGSLNKAKKRLEVERANLADQKALQEALEKRLESLREGLETSNALTPDQILTNRAEELRQQNSDYTLEKRRLMIALVTFIRRHLGRQLAMQDLGGPVVGDQMEIDSDELANRFDDQSSRGVTSHGAGAEDRPGHTSRQAHASHGSDDSGEEDAAAAAAATEMIQLLENLLNASAQSEDTDESVYVDVARGSVCAEFLVRSKVAQFHPGDATMVRLVDFGREVGD
jgi:hypothetical protein